MKAIFIIQTILFLFFTVPACAQPTSLSKKEFDKKYKSITELITRSVTNDTGYFKKLAYLCDTFGPRFSGTENLEKAIDWILNKMQEDGLENVHGEPVYVPQWVRGEESLEIVGPRYKKIPVLGLGGSVGTPTEGVEAELLIVSNFEELKLKKNEAKGKIVLFNFAFTTYGEAMPYRVNGASEAAKVGAVASLVRSVTPFSLATLHTGVMVYEENGKKIPSAAITTEDAMVFERMSKNNIPIKLRLKMSAETKEDVLSRNVIAEYRGWEKPEEVVLVSGHIDSWDVGTGAMDDAGGSLAAWSAVHLLKRLGLKPRRTIRVVLFTNEENGGKGSEVYINLHKDELSKHVLAIESDNGPFKPHGYGFAGPSKALEKIRMFATLLEPIEAGSISLSATGTADILNLTKYNIPVLGLHVNMQKYFWYHHTEADTMDKLDNKEFNLCVASIAIMAFLAADYPERLSGADK